jgi:hypothetical protein
MNRRAKLKPQPLQPARQTGPGVILRGLCVWVPKRIIPRLGALSVVNIPAKQTQSRRRGPVGQGAIVPNKAELGLAGVFGGHGTRTSARQLRQTNPIARSGAPRRCRPWRPAGGPTIPVFQSSSRDHEPTKANVSSRTGRRDPGWSQACETKPNLGEMSYLGDGTPGERRATAPNKANSSIADWVWTCGATLPGASMGRSYKQTQFRPLW